MLNTIIHDLNVNLNFLKTQGVTIRKIHTSLVSFNPFLLGNTPSILHFFLGLDYLFLRETKFHICELTANVVRIVIDTAELNRGFGLSSKLNEIKYCYSLGIFEDKWNLRARPHFPSFIKGLGYSHKGYYNDVIVITGVVEPDLVNKPVLKQFGTLGV